MTDMNECECVCEGSGYHRVGVFTRMKVAVKRWILFYVWCRHLYRPVMRFAHRYNWHYAPPSQLNPIYGEQNHWCQWCGLRGTTYKVDPNESISKNV